MPSRQKFWKGIEKFCIQHRNLPIIISGDLNTRSPLFSDNHRESHEYLVDFVDNTEFSINNTGEPTRGHNALGVTMSNSMANTSIVSWEPLDALTSDHLPVALRSSRSNQGNSLLITSEVLIEWVLNIVQSEVLIDMVPLQGSFQEYSWELHYPFREKNYSFVILS
jgi:hypothetical protein